MSRAIHALAFHSVADIFPLLEGPPFDAFVADIRDHGLREPIVLHPDGTILDGRNRYRACIEAGVEPRFETWDEQGDAVAFSVSLNLHRRHMQESQRGMVAGRIANLENGSNQFHREGSSKELPTSQDEAAALMNVSVSTVKRARKVLESGDAGLIAAVNRGEKRLTAAAVAVAAIKRAKPPASTKEINVKSTRGPSRWEPLERLAAEGNTSGQIAKILGFHRETVVNKARERNIKIPADRIVRGQRDADPDRVLREFVSTLESLMPSCDMIEPEKVDAVVLAECISVMDEAIRALSKLRKRLKTGG